ncbi:MAG: AMP-binding protein [Pseudonocardiaceae bacterium]|nr:AMP-binding protein [Pseudonocardiaceae bacterium]
MAYDAGCAVDGTTTRRRWVNATTLGDLLDRQATEAADSEAAVFPTERATYAELAARAETFARGLVGLGVRRNDRVGILLPASVDLLAMLFAAAKIGAVAVPVNARYKSRELRQIVVHSGMAVLVTAPAQPGAPDLPALVADTFDGLSEQPAGELALTVAPELKHVVALGGDGGAGLTSDAVLVAAGARVGPDVITDMAQSVRVRDTAVLVYTSGTTASPKGAMLSHEALVRLSAGIAFDRMLLAPEDRVWTAIPLFHGGGITFALTCITAGAVFVHPGFFDPATTPAYLSDERVTVALAAFETIWLPVLDSPDFTERDLSRIRLVMVVGVPERLREMAARMPDAVHVSCVAMTESSAFLTLNRLDDPLEKRVTTGGHPMPGMQCRVVDHETGHDVVPGVPGELLFRGPNAFDGYFRDPELTAEAFDEDGWFHSGDLVTRDEDGRLTFLSRLKDMLKVGGENVSAAEVEGFLLGHPAVGIVAVVAAPDDYYVEVPAAFVQLKPGADATEAGLIDYCLGEIATYRVPRYVRFVTEWPMSGTKIQKFRLREQIAEELASRGITEAPRLQSTGG